MPTKTNEQHHTPASIRRTVHLGEFESISVELPIDQGDIEDLGLQPAIWKATLEVDGTLLEWAKCVYQSRNFNVGKGTLDKLSTEIQLIQKHIDALVSKT